MIAIGFIQINMLTTKVEYTEADYSRMWKTYWKFCLRCRYNSGFLMRLTGALIAAVVLLTIAHPEAGYYPLLMVTGIVSIISPVVIGFDYFTYRRLDKSVNKTYYERQNNLAYQLSFDESKLLYNAQEVQWSNYKFYYIGEQDIYIFKTRRELAIAWSANSMDKDVFVDLILYTKRNLKVLPISKKIVLSEGIFRPLLRS